jgi:hypothetical protein
MSPFEVRRERFSEFCILIKRIERQSERKGNGNTQKTKNGKIKHTVKVLDDMPSTKDGEK